MSTDRRELELLELSDMLSRENGRNTLRRLLEHTGFFTDGFHEQSHKHAYNAGERSVGVWLYSEMREASPAWLDKLISEHNDNG